MTGSVIFGEGPQGIWTCHLGVFDAICDTLRPLFGSRHPDIAAEVYSPLDSSFHFIAVETLDERDFCDFLNTLEECLEVSTQNPLMISTHPEFADAVLARMAALRDTLRRSRPRLAKNESDSANTST